MTSKSHKLFLHIFTLFLYEYYLEEEREMALERNPFIWGGEES